MMPVMRILMQILGIAFSDVPESWPALWPREKDPTGTFESVVYNADGSSDTLYFPGLSQSWGRVVFLMHHADWECRRIVKPIL
ncbi:MAG: hypothetical protein CM1200mP10_26520 [Candidatus Neomarinimicrobiota bacterium]|nr:MAG: hypothetical protein CM1200mP10_26520 [Candidatus Neomarinimicrobiota bacterium]